MRIAKFPGLQRHADFGRWPRDAGDPFAPAGAPTISIVTAARNMEAHVAQAIDSVVAQKQPGDQYVFIDGASTDSTMDIARGFGDRIDVLVSEPDEGQYHAIAKGFDHATGDIQAWINADDILMPWTFAVVREVFARFPEVQWITGSPGMMAENGQYTRIRGKLPAHPRQHIANGWFRPPLGGFLQQENMFWRRSLWDRAGGLDLSLRLAADFELWTRFARHADLVPVDVPLAAFRERPGAQRSSAGRDEYEQEVARICADKPPPPRLWAWAGRRGITGRNAAQLAITARHPAIVYDRRALCWKKITRRRSVSRVTLGVLVDEWLMGRAPGYRA